MNVMKLAWDLAEKARIKNLETAPEASKKEYLPECLKLAWKEYKNLKIVKVENLSKSEQERFKRLHHVPSTITGFIPKSLKISLKPYLTLTNLSNNKKVKVIKKGCIAKVKTLLAKAG
jgi:hypothetical protein